MAAFVTLIVRWPVVGAAGIAGVVDWQDKTFGLKTRPRIAPQQDVAWAALALLTSAIK